MTKKLTTIFFIVVAVLAVGFAAVFLASRYLVSKLDGTGGVHAPALEQYSSEDGVSFMYPEKYELSSRQDGNAERAWDVLVLLPKGYVPPVGGEGPPAISMSIFANPEKIALDKWVLGDARPNWKLATDPGGLGSRMVGGEAAFVYKHSGLYETDAVAVAHGGKIFLFEAGWMTPQDAIRTDFENLLNTVQFNP